MFRKVLFIEDEPDQVAVVQARLKKNGYEVITALDGEEGLIKARQEKPDLILLDVIMPKMDGREVCRRLKSNPATQASPVIAITAAGNSGIEHECIAAGASECVRKPYESAELLARMEEILKG
ncbi:MAG: response regulator [Candidatus Omnitrophica bacterium]|nr:response regulator [Candidatus Omnitrophota bacterium]